MPRSASAIRHRSGRRIRRDLTEPKSKGSSCFCKDATTQKNISTQAGFVVIGVELDLCLRAGNWSVTFSCTSMRPEPTLGAMVIKVFCYLGQVDFVEELICRNPDHRQHGMGGLVWTMYSIFLSEYLIHDGGL